MILQIQLLIKNHNSYKWLPFITLRNPVILYHLKLENKNDKMIVDDILMESWRKQKKSF